MIGHRQCPICQRRLVQRVGEEDNNWLRRKTCGRATCIAARKEQRKREIAASVYIGWPRLTEPAPLSATAFANDVSVASVGSAPARPATLPLTRGSIA